MNTMRECFRFTPTFKRFLSAHCFIGGQTDASTFAACFAAYCMESGRKPVPQEVLMLLLERLGDGFLVRARGEWIVRLGCQYDGDLDRFYNKWGIDFYEFDEP